MFEVCVQVELAWDLESVAPVQVILGDSGGPIQLILVHPDPHIHIVRRIYSCFCEAHVLGF